MFAIFCIIINMNKQVGNHYWSNYLRLKAKNINKDEQQIYRPKPITNKSMKNKSFHHGSKITFFGLNIIVAISLIFKHILFVTL